MQVRVLHADDHPSFSGKLREIVEPHAEWVGSVFEADAVVREVLALRPDVILLDISMPGKSGFELTREVVEVLPEAKIIIVSVHDEPSYVDEALRIGACGYVLKNSAARDIVNAIREVHAGGTFLSAALLR